MIVFVPLLGYYCSYSARHSSHRELCLYIFVTGADALFEFWIEQLVLLSPGLRSGQNSRSHGINIKAALCPIQRAIQCPV